MASIAKEIRAGNSKFPGSVKLDSFLFKFTSKGEETLEQKQQRMENSRSAWGSFLRGNIEELKKPPHQRNRKSSHGR